MSRSSWQPRDTITDTPYQVLKLGSWIKFLQDLEQEKIPRGLLQDILVPWLHALENLDKRGVFAWPHSRDDGINTFRLDDNVWVWRSLAELKSLNIWNCQPLTKCAKTVPISWSGVQERWYGHIHSLSQEADEPFALDKAFREFSQIAKRLDPENVQQGVLQRFTVENEVLRKRMLAVTRSPRETRFLLRARDTVLFHAQHCEAFFSKRSFKDLWTNTVDAQPHHEENAEESWENTLRFILSIVAAVCGVTLNKKSRSELLKTSIKVVIGSSAHNGFIPGELDPPNGHAPSLFSRERDRDYYYHAGFEACHVLLLYARRIDEIFQSKEPQNHPSESAASGDGQRPSDSAEIEIGRLIRQLCTPIVEKEVIAALRSQKPGIGQPVSDQNSVMRQLGSDNRRVTSQSSTMKKVLPFNNGLLDASRIKTFEEEWLYSYPEFLTLGKAELTTAVKSMRERMDIAEFLEEISAFMRRSRRKFVEQTIALMRDYPRQFVEEIIALMQESPRDQKKASSGKSGISQTMFGMIITQHIRSVAPHTTSREETWEYKLSPDSKTIAFVVDCPKQRHLGRRDKPSKEVPKDMNNKELWEVLRKARTINSAKKRFIWLPHADEETASLCYVASAEAEQRAMSLFFDRHANFEKHVFDSTNLPLNIWRTEVHLSFYVLGDEEQGEHVGLPPLSKAGFPSQSRKDIRRASIGFRFDGDLFDRYWTCHFIQYIPTTLGKEDFNNDDDTPRRDWEFKFNANGLGRDKERNWWQRKVLELRLLQRIVDAISTGASDILQEVEQELGVGDSIFNLSILAGKRYKSSKDLSDWQRFEQILQAADEDVTENLKNLDKWNRREEDRGDEQPRWTRNDERKYRGYINQVQAPLDQQMWKLEITRNNLRRLRESLTTTRETVQHNLEISREENIRYFTYVTVIFLPLGFAASFYSMGGPPEHTLIISLVQFAAAAFAITIVLLFFARPAITVLLFFAKPIFLVGEILSASGKYFGAEAAKILKYARKARKENLPKKRTDSSDEKEISNPISRKEDDVSGPQPHNPPDQAGDNIDTDWFWLMHLFLEVPAQQLSLAMMALRKGGCSLSVVINVLLALAVLPVYVVSRAFQIVVHLATSVIRILGKSLKS